MQIFFVLTRIKQKIDYKLQSFFRFAEKRIV